MIDWNELKTIAHGFALAAVVLAGILALSWLAVRIGRWYGFIPAALWCAGYIWLDYRHATT